MVDEEVFWDLPGPSAWADRIACSVKERRHATVQVPRLGGPPDLLEALQLRATGSWVGDRRRVLLNEFAGIVEYKDLFEAVAFQLTGERSNGRSPQHLQGALHGHGLVLVVDARETDAALVGAWYRLVDLLSAAGKEGGLDFATITVGCDATPSSNSQSVQEFCWSGVLDDLDVRTYTRRRIAEEGIALDRVVEHSLVELARFDLDLVELAIGERWDGDSTRCARLLERRWETRGLEDDPFEDRHDELEIWSAGCGDVWFGNWTVAVDVPSRRSEAERRVWRGQHQVVFPLLEDYRREIVETAQELDKTEFLKEIARGSEDGDPMTAEIGVVASCASRFILAQELLGWLRNVRNDLAHCRAVPPSTLAKGDRLREALRRSTR